MADLSAWRGDRIEFSGAVVRTTGEALNLSNCTIWMTVKEQGENDLVADNDADSIFQWHWDYVDGGVGIEVEFPETGIFDLTILPGETEDLPTGVQWKYDVQIMFNHDPNDVWTWDQGTFMLIPDVTRTRVAP